MAASRRAASRQAARCANQGVTFHAGENKRWMTYRLPACPADFHRYFNRGFTERAVKAGATVVRPVEMQFHGDLMSEIRDPFGHSWFFATRVEAMTSKTTREAVKHAKL